MPSRSRTLTAFAAVGFVVLRSRTIVGIVTIGCRSRSSSNLAAVNGAVVGAEDALPILVHKHQQITCGRRGFVCESGWTLSAGGKRFRRTG